MKPPKELEEFYFPQVNDRLYHPMAINRAKTFSFSMNLKDLIDTKIWKRTHIEIPGGKYISYSSFFPILVSDKSFSKRFHAWEVNVAIKVMKDIKHTDEEEKEVKQIDSFYKWIRKKYGVNWIKLPVEHIKELFETWKNL